MKLTAKFFKHSAATLLGLGLATGPAHATVLVTPTNDANTLANTILGSGITINNATYTGAAQASGTFTGGNSAGIGIDQGILLTTGSATNAAGPNNAPNTSTPNATPGDPQLNSVVNGVTNDAAALNINFTTTGGNLFFNYVFGSEEYNEFVGSAFNDAFGFFLDGQNIALLPGTSTPVSTNNVNLANNSNYFVNNPPSTTVAAPFDIQYDGFTKVLTAQALNLDSGTHNIKLVIADTADRSFDSGVFIQAGSFAGQPVPPTTPVPFEFSPGLTILALGAATGIAQLSSKAKNKKSLEMLSLTTNDRQA